MKTILLILALLITYAVSEAQNKMPVIDTLGWKFKDTLDANKSKYKLSQEHGLVIQVGDTLFIRDLFKSQWLIFYLLKKQKP